MTEADAIEAMVQAFITTWPTLSETVSGIVGGVPYVLDNERRLSADTFAQHWVESLTSRQHTQGDHPRFERAGFVKVRIYTPANAPAPNGGSKLAARLAGSVRTIYERQQLGGAPAIEPVTLGAGLMQRGGPDGRWYAVTVQHPYRFYEQT